MATVNPETHTLEFDHTDRLQRSPTIWEQQDRRQRLYRAGAAGLAETGAGLTSMNAAKAEALWFSPQFQALGAGLPPHQAFQKQP